MNEDYSAEVRRVYELRDGTNEEIHERYIWQAAMVVERLFPPRNARETFSVLIALNLLNAAVKLPVGEECVSYSYIKGMAACLFLSLARRPQSGVHVYMNVKEQVTYFRVLGVQISFHHLPLYLEIRKILTRVNLDPQHWDGLRLQEIAMSLYLMGNPQVERIDDERMNAIRYKLLHFRKPRLKTLNCQQPNTDICQPLYSLRCPRIRIPRQWPAPPFESERGKLVYQEHSLLSLYTAIRFNIWKSDRFVLYRRRDHRMYRVIRYDGNNYGEVMRYLTEWNPRLNRRKKSSLKIGRLYHVTPQMRIRVLGPYQHLQLISQNNYLCCGSEYRNLCVTYGIATFLASRFPSLRFVSVLNCNRIRTRRRRYTLEGLLSLPSRSRAREMKVWLIEDVNQELRSFDISQFPWGLVHEYLLAEDYYRDYEITRCGSLRGIRAFSCHQLLPPMFEQVIIRNQYARVKELGGKWAVYSLGGERFVSGFIYDRIWYDEEIAAVCGSVNGRLVVLYRFYRQLNEPACSLPSHLMKELNMMHEL